VGFERRHPHLVAVQPGAHLRVGVHGCRRGVRGPAFEENLARCDARIGFQLNAGTSGINPAPTGRAKLTERVVFGGDALQVKEQTLLYFSSGVVARRERILRSVPGQLIDEQSADAFRAEEKITDKKSSARLE